MPNVLVNNDDITVLGPPETVELLLNIGPQGTRGSKFFVGSGNPNSLTSGGEIFGQAIELNDMYINAAPGANYSYLWQYISTPSTNAWVEVLRINPTIYSSNVLVDFTAGTGSSVGEASIVIPIENIVTISGTPLTSDNFNVQYSIVSPVGNPITSSMSVPSLVTEDLVINLAASEFDSGTWQALVGETLVHVFITVVAS